MSTLPFVFPVDGVMLTEAAGRRVGEDLQITCILGAQPTRRCTINGVPCRPGTEDLRATITLKDYRTTLVARDLDSGEETRIEVFFLRRGHRKYRFSLDDNIWFLQNLARQATVYRSMFEDPYLKLLKTMHDRYGTKFHVNIYYECPEHGGFTLAQMPATYQPEWRANADWLRLSCHANANLPHRPYRWASFEQTRFEFDRVHREILRFAGEEAFAGPVTCVHWAETSIEAIRALRSLGIRELVVSGRFHDPTNTPIALHLNAEQCALITIYGYYYDKAEDIFLHRYAGGLQRVPLDQVNALYDTFAKQHPLYTWIELCVHEQYFYPDYVNYMPDYYERFDAGIRWCVEHGYEPAFIADVMEF